MINLMKSIEKKQITFILIRAMSVYVEFASNAFSAKRGDTPVQELLIQVQQIYRRYRHMYKHEDSLKIICELMEFAYEPSAKVIF